MGAGGSLLGAVAQPDVFGTSLRHALGVDRACVDVLIEAGGDLDGPLNLAAGFDRAELVQILLAAGAAPAPTGSTASHRWRARSTTAPGPLPMCLPPSR